MRILLLVIVLLIAGGLAQHYGLLSELGKKAALQQARALVFSDVYVHHGDFTQNVPFHAGGYMFAHYKINRLRTCIVTIQFRLTQPRAGDNWTGLFSYGYPMVAYYGPAGLLETNEALLIPSVMPAGDYELRRQNYVDCDGEKWVEISPAASLTIIAEPKE